MMIIPLTDHQQLHPQSSKPEIQAFSVGSQDHSAEDIQGAQVPTPSFLLYTRDSD